MSLLRINSDTERVLALRNADRADAIASRATERLSSGSRINRASDDASVSSDFDSERYSSRSSLQTPNRPVKVCGLKTR